MNSKQLADAEEIEMQQSDKERAFRKVDEQARIITTLQSENEKLKKSVVFLADVWVTIRTQGFDFVLEHGDPEGIDFVATNAVSKGTPS